MKKIIITNILACFAMLFSYADFEQDMATANNLYEQNQFNDAYEIYAQLAKNKNHSYQLFYNLGATYYQLDSVAQSIYYLEKAAQINNTDKDLLHNLSMAHGRQQDDIDKFPELFIKTFFKKMSGIFSSNLWLILSLLCLWGAAILYYFKNMRKGFFFQKKRWTIPLAIGLFAFLMSFLNNYYNNSTQTAVVFNPTTEIRKSPNAEAESLIIVHEGLKLIVLDQVDNWLKVKMTDNTIGWLQKSTVKLI